MMKKTIPFILLSFLFNNSIALEVTREFDYYSIDPKSVNDIPREIQAKGPHLDQLEGKASAIYHSKIHFYETIYYTQRENHCEIKFLEPRLHGRIQIYRLDPTKTYHSDIIEAVNAYFNSTKTHELTHENIYQVSLEKAEEQIRNRIKHNPYHYCRTAQNEFITIYNQTIQDIQRKNLAFDCKEYGFGGRYGMCKPISRDTVQKTTDKAECKGELVEAFKGKFYCVSGDFVK